MGRRFDEQERQELESLSARAAGGDQAAFGTLVERTHRVVYRVAFRLVGSQAEADDVTQETYLRAWEGIGSVRDHGAVVGWLCSIARYAAHDRIRRRARRRIDSLDAPAREGMRALIDEVEADEPGPEDRLGSAQVGAALHEALGRLKEKHRTVLALREIDGMTYEEIAEALGISMGTVESRLHRARKALEKVLKGLARELGKEIRT